MKAILLLSLTFALCDHLALATTNNNSDNESIGVQKFSSVFISKIIVTSYNVDLQINGNADEETIVEVYASLNDDNKNWSKEEIQEELNKNYTLVLMEENGELIVTAEQKDTELSSKKNLNISFKITAPSKINSQLNTSCGNISLNNLSGNLNFKTNGSNLCINDVLGGISGHASGGSVQVSNSKKTYISSQGGDITIEAYKGKLRLHSHGSNVYIKEGVKVFKK